MIVYPVKGINEDNEDADGMIVDAAGRALEVAEIVQALNAPRPEMNAAPQPPVTTHRSMPGLGESPDSSNGDTSRQPCETGSDDTAAAPAFLCEAWGRRVWKCSEQCDKCFRSQHENKEPAPEGGRERNG
jgi:hypothetical protein